MIERNRIVANKVLRLCAISLAAGAACQGAWAQASSANTATGGLAPDRSPYYIGASQGFSHDTNVYKVPFGPSDTYSTTSLLAGFDQPISRQRLFGNANVAYNKYFSESALDNVSYNLATGVDWATVMRLSGRVQATLDQQLAAPTANVNPQQEKNLQRRQGFSGFAQWGGDAALTLQANAATSKVDYGSSTYSSAEARDTEAGLSIYYRPGARLRVGAGVRYDRTRVPRAIQLNDGTTLGNTQTGRSVDLLASYDNGNSLFFDGRIGYTRSTNSLISDADFNGVTGNLSVNWRATAKIAFSAGASRSTGLESQTTAYGVITPTLVQTPTGAPALTNTVTILSSNYETNQLTDSVYVGASYAATAKIGVTANARYSRAKVVSAQSASTSGNQARVDTKDENTGASLGVDYAFSRPLSFACGVSRERREVRGFVSFGYTYTIAGCNATFIWR